MTEKTYSVIDVVGVSDESIHQAVRNALMKAGQTLRNLDWFEVDQIRGAVKNGQPEFQVQVKIGFRLEGDAAA
jgi:flavin-binding protein dodecin